MNTSDLCAARWRKSTHSSSNANCVEVARNLPGIVAVRDSKDPSGAVLSFSPEQWQSFTGGIKAGASPVYDLGLAPASRTAG
jgi:hypothetical protein